jgi:sister-chromatid-cohesion protein PDS5
MYGDPHKAAEDLYAFAKNNDQRQFRLLRTCMDPAVDVKTISKAQVCFLTLQVSEHTLSVVTLQAEFIKRVEQTQSAVLTTMSAVLRRASFWIINTSMIGYFLQQVQEYLDEGVSDQRDLDAILHIVKYVAKHCPKMLEGHAQDLSEAVAKMSSQEKKLGPLMTQESEIYLITLAGIAKGSKKGSPRYFTDFRVPATMLIQCASDRTHTPLNANDPNALRAANHFIKKSSARHAKFAARILAYSDESRDTCATIAHVRFPTLSLGEILMSCYSL